MNIKFKRKLAAKFCTIAILGMFIEMVAPFYAYALTSGPSQPEFQSFEPFSTTNMVNTFSGDFTYNIPLFELPGPDGGYPFNLAYHSGITMEQEASWVGLGWSLNAGAINRSIRGIPDDFNGDPITETVDQKPDITVGAGVGFYWEFGGIDPADDTQEAIQAAIDAAGPLSGSFNIDLTVKYNNYRGLGFSVAPGGSLGLDAKDNKNYSMNFTASASFDSQDGVGFSGGFNNSFNGGKWGFGTSFSYNSRAGLTGIGLNGSWKRDKELDKNSFNSKKQSNYKVPSGDGSVKYYKRSSGSFGIGYSRFTSFPFAELEYTGGNVNGQVKLGTSIFPNATDLGLSIHGFMSTKKLKFRNFPVSQESYGYMYAENADRKSVRDFIREKDMPYTKSMLNLPTPVFTNDNYSIVGQGIGTSVRPYRSDIGVLRDNFIRSIYNGFGLGVDLNPGPGVKFGVNAQYVNTTENNKVPNVNYGFKGREGKYTDYESFYFKSPTEMAAEPLTNMNYIGGEEIVRPYTKALTVANELKKPDGSNLNSTGYRSSRKPRANNVQTFTNEQLLKQNVDGGYVLAEFNSKIKEENGTYSDFNQGHRNSGGNFNHHIGAFSMINESGLRYNYGIPIYNNFQNEYVFTVEQPNEIEEKKCQKTVDIKLDGGEIKRNYPKTSKYYNKTTTPDYASQYLLTSILGTDYIDVNNDGIDDEDYGYWVKFNYTKNHENQGWRAPFFGANYIKGLNSTIGDDNGSFMYGEKEVFLLESVETKSHKVEFIIDEKGYRLDGIGATKELQTSEHDIDCSQQVIEENLSHRLDKIKVYSKSEIGNNVLLKTIHFEYDYSLCQGVQNNIINFNNSLCNSLLPLFHNPDVEENKKNGKLTLKKVWVTNQQNNRGEKNPYVFNYFEDNKLANPDYNSFSFDRWGYYRDLSLEVNNNDCIPFDEDDMCENCEIIDYPYVYQQIFDIDDSPEERQIKKARLDQSKSTWNLRNIRLPSGGDIFVDYESNDYAYVQNKVAGQMFKIKETGAGLANQHQLNPPCANCYKLDNDVAGRTLYFDLVEPIYKIEDLKKYFEGLHKDNHGYQLYFSTKI